MATLRERLRQDMPDLHTALERSWAIAHDEWLPTLGTSQDSYNSYPHLRNLERYLEQIAAEHDAIHGASEPLLSPFEIYVMLAGILFHDIGRAHSDKGHGEHSGQIIEQQYASLGIPSQAVAESIARIAHFHDLPSSECRDWLRLGKVRTATISPYGEVRERVCAALLVLSDHLDGAATRVVPAYVRPGTEPEVKGAFRRAVQGVEVDLRARMVKVVLSNDLKRATPGWDPGDPPPVKWKCDDLSQIFAALGLPVRPWPEAKTSVARDESKSERRRRSAWWPEEIVTILLSDARKNGEEVDAVKTVLTAVGVPINAWLLEVDEHLFNRSGRETYEPVFNRAYLERVARAMWDLSVRVFAHGAFSYETLAAQVGEPDCERVRRAVRRVSILCTARPRQPEGREQEGVPPTPFWVGRDRWRWNVTPRGRDQGPCDYVSLDDITGMLRERESPNGEHE